MIYFDVRKSITLEINQLVSFLSINIVWAIPELIVIGKGRGLESSQIKMYLCWVFLIYNEHPYLIIDIVCAYIKGLLTLLYSMQ